MMEAITDLQFFDGIHDLKEETAIPNEAVVLAQNDGELGRQSFMVASRDFREERGGLLTGKDSEREAHEIRVRHQGGKVIQIGAGKGVQV